MKILVAGGLGFIGYYLSKKLLDEGHEVICLDNAYNGKINQLNKNLFNNANFTYIHKDICNPIKGLKIDQIYNLACPASSNHYNRDPVATTKVNTLGVINLLDLARENNARFLQVSTSDVYLERYDTVSESSDIGLRSGRFNYKGFYSNAKLAAESIIYNYSHSDIVDANIVRLFSTFGYFPFQNQNDERLIHTWIQKALNNEDIIIYGEPDRMRSFIYIDDTVNAIHNVINYENRSCAPVNICSSQVISLGDLAKTIIELTDSKSEIKQLPGLPGDKYNIVADINYHFSYYDYEIQTEFDVGLIKTIEQFKSQHG